MKSHYLLVLCVLPLCFTLNLKAQIKIGDNPNSINQNSLVELESTNKGFVFPRIALTNVSTSNPLASDLLAGTVVFNTSSSTTGGSGVGLYAWDGAKWQSLNAANAIAQSWSLTGNGTTNASNFLGTTDSLGLSLRTANTEAIHIDSLQNVSIGVPNTSYKFEQSGTFRIHKDSLNIMYSPDIFPGFVPGMEFAGVVLNTVGGNGNVVNGVAHLPSQANDQQVAVMGYLNSATIEQAIVSANPGDISMSTQTSTAQSGVDVQNGQIDINTNKNNNNDSSNSIRMSDYGININRNINGIGNTGMNFNDSAIYFNVNESINNKNTGFNINPGGYNIGNNDPSTNSNSNYGLNSSGYNLNINDNNQQTNLNESANSNQLQYNINDNANNVHTNFRMDSTLGFSLNRNNESTGLNMSSNGMSLSRNDFNQTSSNISLVKNALFFNVYDFNQNQNSAINLNNNSIALSLNNQTNNSNFLMNNGSASFTSNNSFNVSIGNNNPQANLDVTGNIRSTDLSGGGVVMADNNGILYVANAAPKKIINYIYPVSGSGIIVSAATLDLSGSGNFAPGSVDVIVTIPNSINNMQATVAVSPNQDLPNNVAIASARLISPTQVKIRLLNNGTNSQVISGQLYLTITQF